mmetsp:Transcript_1802/g.5374  ORF Transcript_1802/g.5374 Transcript_1802/m.5374 type:complete len:221 (+) Transcript_1802:548-1210(+)
MRISAAEEEPWRRHWTRSPRSAPLRSAYITTWSSSCRCGCWSLDTRCLISTTTGLTSSESSTSYAIPSSIPTIVNDGGLESEEESSSSEGGGVQTKSWSFLCVTPRPVRLSYSAMALSSAPVPNSVRAVCSTCDFKSAASSALSSLRATAFARTSHAFSDTFATSPTVLPVAAAFKLCKTSRFVSADALSKTRRAASSLVSTTAPTAAASSSSASAPRAP